MGRRARNFIGFSVAVFFIFMMAVAVLPGLNRHLEMVEKKRSHVQVVMPNGKNILRN